MISEIDLNDWHYVGSIPIKQAKLGDLVNTRDTFPTFLTFQKNFGSMSEALMLNSKVSVFLNQDCVVGLWLKK